MRDYLQHHVADAQGLEQLSAVAQVSKSYLVREFHRAVGLPPHAYRRFKAAYGVTPLRYVRAVRHPTRAVGVGNQRGQGSGARGFNNGGQDPGWRVG